MEVLEAIKARRSIRKFSEDPVSAQDLGAILQAATLAPSPGNKQQWHFIVVKNRDVLRRMRAAVEAEVLALASFGQDRGMLAEAREVKGRLPVNVFFETAPLTIAVCERLDPVDGRDRLWRAMGTTDAQTERLRPSRGLQAIGASIQNLMLAAASLGYGTCWMTGPLIAVHQLEEILGIAPPFRLVSLIPIGRPAESPPARPRKGLAGVITVVE